LFVSGQIDPGVSINIRTRRHGRDIIAVIDVAILGRALDIIGFTFGSTSTIPISWRTSGRSLESGHEVGISVFSGYPLKDVEYSVQGVRLLAEA
jgi:hypothetical protein